MRVLGRVGAQIFHERIAELEKRVQELQESLQAMRGVLEMIREAVVNAGK